MPAALGGDANGVAASGQRRFLRRMSGRDTLQRVLRKLVPDISSIQRRHRFKDHDFHFLRGEGLVLNASWHDKKLTGTDRDDACAQSQFHDPTMNQKQLVFCVVLMPDKLALEFDALDTLTIQLTGDVRVPVCCDRGKDLREINGRHIKRELA